MVRDKKKEELIEHCLYESGLTADGCWNELDDYAKESIERFANLLLQESRPGMKQITDKEYELFEKLKKIWFHSKPEWSGSYFICGEAGERDQMGLPEHIMVCPAYGSDGMAMYTMSKPYSAPGY